MPILDVTPNQNPNAPGTLIFGKELPSGEIAEAFKVDTEGNVTLNGSPFTSASGAPAYGMTPTALPKWRSAVAGMRIGTGSAKLLCIGDSTTQGVGATGGAQQSYPYRLTDLLNSYYGPTINGLGIPPQVGGVDSRWTVGSGWSYAGTIGWGGSASYTATTGAAGNLVFNPGTNVDTMDIYCYRNTTLGSVVATINGTPTTITQTGAAGVFKQTITFTAGTYSVSFAPPTGTVHIIGVDAYLSTDRKIRVGNAGVGSSRSAGWASPTAFGSANCITTHAPDLTICMLGINDSSDLVTPAVRQGYILTLATAARASGDFIVMSVIPSQDAPKIPYEEAYRDADKALCAAQGWPFIDIYSRYGSYAIANGLGFMNDNLHPNARGYADVAAAVFAAITTIG